MTAGVVSGAGPLAILSTDTDTTVTDTTATDTTTTTEEGTTEETTTEETTTEPEPSAGTCVATGNETIGTDKPDYAPDETVRMTGAGYSADCLVVVKVTRPDGSVVTGDGSFEPGSDTVRTGADGTLAYDYILDGILGEYQVEVLGEGNAVVASTTFADHFSFNVSINGGATSTNTLAVTLNLSWSTFSGSPDPTQARYANDTNGGDCDSLGTGTWSAWEAIADAGNNNTATKAWTLAAGGAGTRKVCVETAHGAVGTPSGAQQDDDTISYTACTDPGSGSATGLPFTSSFACSNTNTVDMDGWVDSDGSGSNAVVANGSPRSGSPTEQHARLSNNAFITRTIDTTGYTNIQLSFYWRGDNDANPVERLRVYWRPNSGSFLQLGEYGLYNNETWRQVTLNLPTGAASPNADNKTILILFYGDTNSSDEQARVDDVLVTGTATPVGPTKLAFTTTAFTQPVFACFGPITVQTQNASSVATDVTANTTVNLTTDNGTTGNGAFYSDSGCTSAVTTRTIASGSNSASFYYKATNRGDGTHELTAAARWLTSASQTETIDKAAITATAGSGSWTYDGSAQSPSACVVTGDYTSGVSCTNSPATVGPDVGSGTVTPDVSGADAANFDVTSQNGTWEITKAAVTATAGSGSWTYNGTTRSPSDCDVTGAYTGDLDCTNNPATVGPDVGSDAVTPVVSGTGLDNFSVTEVGGTWEITPAAVTATAGSGSWTYDGEKHSPSACVVTGDYTTGVSCENDPAEVGPEVGSGTVSPIVSGAGVGNVNIMGIAVSNFDVTKVDGTWEITKAPVTITAGDYTGTFDASAHSPSACAVGGTYKGALTCTNNPTSVGPNVGSGAVSPVLVLNGEDEDNFDVTAYDGSWVIGQKTLTVSADNQSVQYSDLTPSPLTFAYSGFEGTDDADDLDTKPSCTTTRLVSSQASPPTFPITCSGGADTNYAFHYVAGTFTVTKENATVLFDAANPASHQVSSPGGDYTGPALTFKVTVQETEPDLPAALAEAGDIDNAGLKVEIKAAFGSGSVSVNCVVGVNGTGYDGVKTYTCTTTEPILVNTYDVIATVEGNYYIGTGLDGFTVYDPSLGFATGGGWFLLDGEKVNFGFVMKYGKNGSNVKGSFLAIRHHADGTISRIKSNALEGLALRQWNGCGIATFSGKSTYTTWDPNANAGAGGYVTTGGQNFAVYAEDCNEPGTGVDSIQVKGAGNLAMTAKVVISGGNIAVPHKPAK